MGDRGAGAGAVHATSTSATRDTNIRFDQAYVRTLPGLLKITEMVLNLLGFVCIEASAHSHHGTGSWFNAVAMGGFWFTGVTFALHLFHVVEKLHRIPWTKIEFGFGALWTPLYVVAASLAAVFGVAAFAAAAFFGFCAAVAYGYDAFLKFRHLRTGRLEQGVKVVSKETTSPADA